MLLIVCSGLIDRSILLPAPQRNFLKSPSSTKAAEPSPIPVTWSKTWVKRWHEVDSKHVWIQFISRILLLRPSYSTVKPIPIFLEKQPLTHNAIATLNFYYWVTHTHTYHHTKPIIISSLQPSPPNKPLPHLHPFRFFFNFCLVTPSSIYPISKPHIIYLRQEQRQTETSFHSCMCKFPTFEVSLFSEHMSSFRYRR